MSFRVPGPIGFILNQAPSSRSADAGVKTGASSRAPLGRKDLTPRAVVVRGQHSSAAFDCRRGDTIVLEAAGPGSNAQRFEWSFVVDRLPVVQSGQLYTEENPPPGRTLSGSKEGRRVSVVALASFTAKLAVTDGASASAASPLEVRVQPRPWKTSFNQRPQLQTFSKFYSANFLAEKHAGKNVCAICGTDEPYADMIHHSQGRLDWKEQFGLKKVEDPGGPFDGLWFVQSADLRIDRGMYINSELTTGQIHRLNSKKSTPPEYQEGLKARIECTKLHERLHGELIKEKLAEPGMDPAPRVEALIGVDEESLAEQANTEVALKENFLSKSTTGPDGHGALRKRLESQLKTTRVKFLLPQSEKDEKGVEVETDLLGFSD
jgi:hypothetical protein